MVERCRNMDAHGRRRNMHVSTASSTDNLAKSVLGRRVPSGSTVRHKITIHVNASTHTNHHTLPKAGCDQKLIHKKLGCEVILSANRPHSRYQTPPIQLHTSGVVKRSHGSGTLFSTTSMFVQRSTILIYIHPELL